MNDVAANDDALRRPGRSVMLGSATLALGRGGIASVARMIAHVLVDNGADLRLVSYLDDEVPLVAGISGKGCKGSKVRFLAETARAALYCRHFIYDSAGMARAHPRLLRPRSGYAVWIHGVEVWEGMAPRVRPLLERASLVLSSSQHSINRHTALYGPLPNAKPCPLATEADEEPPACPPRAGPPTVLILSRIDLNELYKGHLELIAAWPAVTAAVPGARLVIAGGGSGLETIRKAAANSPVARLIEVAGFVPTDAIETLWQRADVLAMPSRGEGFGLVYVEAMRRGLPVVASRHDAGQEVNIDGETGYNVDLGNPRSLVVAVVSLLADEERRKAMGEAGRRRWRQHFRFSGFKRRLTPLLEGYLAGAGC